MRLTRRIPALLVAGLSVALIASAATTAIAAPKPPTVAPKPGHWRTVTSGCPEPNGKVDATSTATMIYPTSKIDLTVIVFGYVNDSAVLGPNLQVDIILHTSKLRKDIVSADPVNIKTNGAPAFAYTLSFAKATKASQRKAVTAEVADAVSRARKQEAVARDLLVRTQPRAWGKSGVCVKATFKPNNQRVNPKETGLTTGSLTSVSDGAFLKSNWKLVKTYIGQLDNTTQNQKINPDFPWTAAAKADAYNNLVKVTLRATSKEGLADVTFIATKKLGKVHVEVSLALIGDTPAGSPSDIGELKFGASLIFDATEQKGMPGVYALDGDANWSFPVQSVTLAKGSDCLDATINALSTSSPLAGGTPSPDMPAGDTDVIQLDPSNQWRFTPTFLYFLQTTETQPPTNPNNCTGNELWWQVFNGQVDVPPPFAPSGNYLDTVLPNGDLNVTQTVDWTRDLGGLSIPLLTGAVSATVKVTPIPNPNG